MFPVNVRRRSLWWRVPILQRCFQSFKNRILLPCTLGLGKSISYRKLLCSSSMSTATITAPPPPTPPVAADSGFDTGDVDSPEDVDYGNSHDHEDSSDLVALKISLLGDCHIGKTSFLKKYVGREKGEEEEEEEEEEERLHVSGLNQMDKTQCVKGARIAYSIWEVEGFDTSQDHIPAACIDSVAMLFMFDLTSRCTLNSVIGWYQEARKWNQTAIPVLIGAKFDDFIQLPIDLQWTIATQARAYAKALNATLFFSSATYNINVNKIFKFITAKLFNLPWSPERNLTIGEPIIDF